MLEFMKLLTILIMNELQQRIATEILILINNHNGHIFEYKLLDFLYDKFLENQKEEFTFVISRLIEDYNLIYQSNAWLCLTSNGEIAVNMGVAKYIKKLHANKRLDIRMKELEIISKLISIFKDSKTLLIIFITIIVNLVLFVLGYVIFLL